MLRVSSDKSPPSQAPSRNQMPGDRDQKQDFASLVDSNASDSQRLRPDSATPGRPAAAPPAPKQDRRADTATTPQSPAAESPELQNTTAPQTSARAAGGANASSTDKAALTHKADRDADEGSDNFGATPVVTSTIAPVAFVPVTTPATAPPASDKDAEAASDGSAGNNPSALLPEALASAVEGGAEEAPSNPSEVSKGEDELSIGSENDKYPQAANSGESTAASDSTNIPAIAATPSSPGTATSPLGIVREASATIATGITMAGTAHAKPFIGKSGDAVAAEAGASETDADTPEPAGAVAAPATTPAGGASSTPDKTATNAAAVLAKAEDPDAIDAGLHHDRHSGAATTHIGSGDASQQIVLGGLTSSSSVNGTAATSAPANSGIPAGAAIPINGLAVEITANVQIGRSRFEIRLDPPELGRIDVRLDVDRNGQVTSHLTVEKPATLDMLRRDAPQLQQALQDAGLKTGDNGLQFSLRDQSSSSQQHDRGTEQHRHHLVINEDETVAVQTVGRSYGRSFNSSNGVDIQV